MNTLSQTGFRSRPFAHKLPSAAPKPIVLGDDWPTAAKRILSPGQNIFSEGDTVEHFYKIKSGCVRSFKILLDGRRLIDAFYIPGDIFGVELGDRRGISAEAVTRSEVFFVHRKQYGMRGAKNHKATENLLETTLAELRRSQNHGIQLLKGAQERVVGFLLDIAERQNSQRVVNLPMSRLDIANHWPAPGLDDTDLSEPGPSLELHRA